MPSIVYEHKKAIYCAIEKCAITRLIAYFGDTYDLNYKNKNKNAEQIFYPAHKSIESHNPLSYAKRYYPGFFTFAFIRNPFDRAVSHYCHSIRNYPGLTFHEYIHNKAYNIPLKPMSFHLDVEPDFTGRYENFKEDFDRLNEHFGTKNYTDDNHPLKRIENRGKRGLGHYKNYFKDDEELIEITRKKFQVDLDRWGYKY